MLIPLRIVYGCFFASMCSTWDRLYGPQSIYYLILDRKSFLTPSLALEVTLKSELIHVQHSEQCLAFIYGKYWSLISTTSQALV